MKRFSTLFLSFSLMVAALTFSTCGDDDNVNPISFIGRPFGWKIAAVTSDFQQKADAAIAALTDEEIAAAGRTRAEITDAFNASIDRQTKVEDCDLDDDLFFVGNGVVQISKGDVICPGVGDPTVLGHFNNSTYTTNADATMMTFREADGSVRGVYDIAVLMDGLMELEQSRTVSDTLVGTVRYDINFRLTGNE